MTLIHPLSLVRYISAFALCLLLAGGCSTQSGTSLHAENGGPPQDLPAIAELDNIEPREASLTNETSFAFVGRDRTMSNGAVEEAGGDGLLLVPGTGLSFALYSVQDLGPSDGLLTATIDADTLDPGAPGPLQYLIGTAWYGENRWEFSTLQTQGDEHVVNLPPFADVVSPGGRAYIAVVVPPGASLRLNSITIEVALHGRDANHITSDLPQRDTAGVDIAFPITVVDENGFRSYDFSGDGTLSGSAPDMVVVQQPSFVDGQGIAIVRFPTPGTYTVSVSGLGSLDAGVGQILVYQTRLPVYSITIDEESLDDLIQDPYISSYRPGSVNIDGVQFDGIEMHFRGSSARAMPKKSWKLKLNNAGAYSDPDWGYDRKIINLNAGYIDSSLMREVLSYQLLADLGMVTPRARFAHVRVNGVFWGVYSDVEEPSKPMLASYGVNDGGSLYQAKASNMSVIGDGTADDYVGPFDKETRTLEPYTDLADFIDELNNWPQPNVNAELSQSFDVGGFNRYLVGNALVSQGDHLRKNYFVYHDELGTGKWMVIPWDYDLTWGRNWDEDLGLFDPAIRVNNHIDIGLVELSGYNNILHDRYLTDPQFKANYRTALQLALNNEFSTSAQVARIDAYYDLIVDDALADTQKWGSNSEYNTRVQELRDYIPARRQFLLDTMAGE